MLALLCTVTFICAITATPSTGPGPNLVGDSPQARTLFYTADKDHDHFLTRAEFHLAFLEFDKDHNGQVTLTEFLQEWTLKNFGPAEQCVNLFNNLDVNRDSLLTEPVDMPLIFYYFDRDGWCSEENVILSRLNANEMQ